MRKAPTLRAALVAAALLAAGCGGDGSGTGAESRSLTAAEEAGGFTIDRIALTARGAMIDVRYTVIDPDRTLATLGHGQWAETPMLMDANRVVPLQEVTAMGDLTAHGASFRAGMTYFWVFANQGGLLGEGDSLDLVVGDFRMEGLVIE